MVDREWTLRRRSLRRRFVLADADRAELGTLAAGSCWAEAVSATGEATELRFAPAKRAAAMAIDAYRDGRIVAQLSPSWVLTVAARRFHWDTPYGRMAPITIREGDETVLRVERRAWRQARLGIALELPEPFVVATMACVYAANGGPVDTGGMIFNGSGV